MKSCSWWRYFVLLVNSFVAFNTFTKNPILILPQIGTKRKSIICSGVKRNCSGGFPCSWGLSRGKPRKQISQHNLVFVSFYVGMVFVDTFFSTPVSAFGRGKTCVHLVLSEATQISVKFSLDGRTRHALSLGHLDPVYSRCVFAVLQYQSNLQDFWYFLDTIFSSWSW